MMRRPSTTADLYRWHQRAVRGEAPPVHEGLPECGWFKARLVKGGPWVPVRIWCEREICPATGELTAPEVLRCEADGMRRDPANVWTFLTPITRAEFETMIAMRETIPAMEATMAKIDLTKEAMRP